MFFPCFCRVSQSVLNDLVADVDQQNHAIAKVKGVDMKIPAFRCSKCGTICIDYAFDKEKVSEFRLKFTGARYTYILVDRTRSMTSTLPNNTKPRINQTKIAVKQLLNEIAKNSGSEDKAILTMFDD
jgi:hypothetical protein